MFIFDTIYFLLGLIGVFSFSVMAKSIKVNFIYNLINTISGLLFPVITFPYASRILLEDGIGQIQFYNSIINYIILLTGIGIPIYAVREIARVRDNKKLLSQTTVEIILLNLFFNVLGYIAVAFLCFFVDRLQENVSVFLLLSLSIVLTTIGCPWFYKGVEDFKYVTLRGLAVKSVCVLILFLLVKTREDLIWYALYTVLVSVGNYILNFIRLRKYIDVKSFLIKEINIWRHIKPSLAVFMFSLITSIYLNLDTVMLGFLKDDANVGYYTAATKLSHVIVMIVTSLGGVMLPRLSNLIKNNKTDEFFKLAQKSYHFVLLVSFPICAGVFIMASPMIMLFSGKTFLPAVYTLQIISPIIVFIGISNLIGMQVLYPLGKIGLVTLSTFIGAVINFTLNCILIPTYAQDGAAFATVTAEFGVTLSQLYIVKNYIPFRLFDKKVVLYFFSSVLMFFVCNLFLNLHYSESVNMIFVPILGTIVYAAILMIMRDSQIRDIINIVKRKK